MPRKHFLLFLLYTSLQCVAAAFSLGAYFAESAASMPRRPRKPVAFLGKEDPEATAQWRADLEKYAASQARPYRWLQEVAIGAKVWKI